MAVGEVAITLLVNNLIRIISKQKTVIALKIIQILCYGIWVVVVATNTWVNVSQKLIITMCAAVHYNEFLISYIKLHIK